MPCVSETMVEGGGSRDGFSNGPERRDGLTGLPCISETVHESAERRDGLLFSDGSARLRTRTRLAIKSMVKLELADSQNSPGRLDEFGTMEISEFHCFPTDLASAKDSRTQNPSCVLIKSLDGPALHGKHFRTP